MNHGGLEGPLPSDGLPAENFNAGQFTIKEEEVVNYITGLSSSTAEGFGELEETEQKKLVKETGKFVVNLTNSVYSIEVELDVDNLVFHKI